MPRPDKVKKDKPRHDPLETQMRAKQLQREGPLRAPRAQPRALTGAAGDDDDDDDNSGAGAAAAAAAGAGAGANMFAALNPRVNPAMRSTHNPPALAPPSANTAVKPAKLSKAEAAAAAAQAAAAAAGTKGRAKAANAKATAKAKVPSRLVKNTRTIGDDDDDDDAGSDDGMGVAAALGVGAGAGAAGDDDDDDGDDDAAPAVISAKQSKKIIDLAGEQMRADATDSQHSKLIESLSEGERKIKAMAQAAGGEDGDDDDEDGAKIDPEDVDAGDDDPTDVTLSAEDQKDMEMYYPAATKERRTLADMIMEKFKDAEKRLGPAAGAPAGAPASGAADSDKPFDYVAKKMDPQVVEVYTAVGKYLHHYTSGKVPSAFRMIPALKNWEEILFLTTPDGWTAQATYAATKVFASNLNPKMAQRFYNLVLLPKVRSDISAHKKLNFHLYQALKKAIYKPAAFFRGVLLPLCEEGASVREAVIFSSLLTRCTIPVLHTSVAILKLTQMPYSGTGTLVLKTLINKKYNLPNKVIENLVRYFVGFIRDERQMPVIWHQNLLTFVQRYKHDLTAKHKAAIHHLITIQKHRVMSPEIDRELRAQEPTVDLTKPAQKNPALFGAAGAAAPAAGSGAGLVFVANRPAAAGPTRPGQAGAARMDV